MSTKNDRIRLVLVGIVAAFVISGGSVKADFTFGTPQNLWDALKGNGLSPCISDDGLELYFSSSRKSEYGGYGGYDIWVVTRPTAEDEWGESNNLGELINTDVEDANPTLSADGLELYFNSFRTDGLGGTDLWVTRRATKSDPWGEPVNLGQPINSEKHESAPSISADGLELYFDFYDPCLPDDDPSQRFYVSKRETTDSSWGEPVILDPVINSWPVQWEPEISSDGLVLLWADYWNGDPRPGGFGDTDLWYSRATKDGQWSEPVNLGSAINTSFAESGPAISPDCNTLYFSSRRFLAPWGSGKYQPMNIVYEAPILPVVDFDGDGIVATNDLLMLIENWGTDDPQCDIGPKPWGDGIVDAADLEVLMKYWGQDVTGLVAHWKFDETEGIIAYDSAGKNDANLIGDPVWQPSGGWLDGALELDGVDDGAVTGFILNLVDSPFTALAWVKGGGPDQVIISQAKGQFGIGVNWLMTDPTTGNLMTELKCFNENMVPGTDLLSSAQITDGQWHHVGLVWDLFGTRILYVDGIEVAKDTMQEGTFGFGEDGGINIGFQASILHRPGYWSGLIDDVRIYDRALTPEQIAALSQ